MCNAGGMCTWFLWFYTTATTAAQDQARDTKNAAQREQHKDTTQHGETAPQRAVGRGHIYTLSTVWEVLGRNTPSLVGSCLVLCWCTVTF